MFILGGAETNGNRFGYEIRSQGMFRLALSQE